MIKLTNQIQMNKSYTPPGKTNTSQENLFTSYFLPGMNDLMILYSIW